MQSTRLIWFKIIRMSAQKYLQISSKPTISPPRRWLANSRTPLKARRIPSSPRLSRRTDARSSSRRKTYSSSSTSYAAKSCQRRVAHQATRLNPRSTCSRSPISFRSAAYPSNRRKGAGSSSVSACGMYKNEKVSLWRLQDSVSRPTCVTNNLSY